MNCLTDVGSVFSQFYADPDLRDCIISHHHVRMDVGVGLLVVLEGVEGGESLGAHVAGVQQLLVRVLLANMPAMRLFFNF